MGKASRTKLERSPETAPGTGEAIPEVSGREPCPCGSGKRYKMCHGTKRRARTGPIDRRTFGGIPGEGDLVAMREIVPAATSVYRTNADHGARDVTVCTILPNAIPALHRADGTIFVALQTLTHTDDPSRDVGAAVVAALAAEPGNPISMIPLSGDRPRLQDVLDLGVEPTLALHESFGFWAHDATDPGLEQLIEQAGEGIVPTDRLTDVDAAYWCRIGHREHLRMVLTDDEERVLDALARLHVDGGNGLAEGSRYLGAFRAHGLVVPVWDLPSGWTAEDTEEPAARWRARYETAVASDAPLTADERRARAGVVSRQLTLR